MLSDYQSKKADLYNILIGNIKKLVNFIDKEKHAIHYEKFKLYLRLKLKLKYIHRLLEFNKSQWLMAKTICWIQHTKRIEVEKNGDEVGEALYKLMNNAVNGKAIEDLRNRINVKLVSNRKHYLKWASKPSYMSHKIFDIDLFAIRKNKVANNT